MGAVKQKLKKPHKKQLSRQEIKAKRKYEQEWKDRMRQGGWERWT